MNLMIVEYIFDFDKIPRNKQRVRSRERAGQAVGPPIQIQFLAHFLFK